MERYIPHQMSPQVACPGPGMILGKCVVVDFTRVCPGKRLGNHYPSMQQSSAFIIYSYMKALRSSKVLNTVHHLVSSQERKIESHAVLGFGINNNGERKILEDTVTYPYPFSNHWPQD